MTPTVVESEIKSILKNKFSEEEVSQFSISPPPPHINLDASTNFALILSKKSGKKSDDIFKEISILLAAHGFETEFTSGFMNIKFNKLIYEKYINFLYSSPNPFTDKKNKTRILIEFVSANPTGPLHLASASGACLGDSLSNIMKELGFEVFKEYYVNNVGNQIELLGISLMSRFLGNEPPEDGYKGEYLIDLAKKLPPEAKEWAEKNEILKFSQFAINEIITQQKKDLSDFGLVFDRWFMESELHKKKLPDKILDILKQKQAVEEKDGAIWLKMDDKNEDKERVLVKSNGAKTYFLNDLAYHYDKYERGFDWIIDIWGADHHGYIPRMKAGIKTLGLDEKKFTVIIHQLVSIKKGNEILKMSKRTGRFYTLRQLIDETSKDAVRFFFTMRSPNTHLIFDIDLATKQSNENPLYYVQYAYARINSIIKNASEKRIEETWSFEKYELSKDDRKILKKIFWFERILKQCLKDLSPHHITTYLIDLAGEFHGYYERNRVLDESDLLTTHARLFILKGIKAILKKGLDLIGVSAPEKM
ncbi:MAG: arginine--tRNA ligase [Elusimicrobiota bacterium]